MNEQAKIIDGRAEMIREIRRRGKVHVYSVLDAEFPIEKQAAIDFVKENDNCYLLVWPDGHKRIELREGNDQ